MDPTTLILIGVAALAVVAVTAVTLRRAWGNASDRPPPAPPSMPPNAPPDLDDQVRHALRHSNKIAAIKHVRELTGMGLKEAKQYVEWVAHALPPAGPAPDIREPSERVDIGEEVRRLRAQGRTIEAIRLVRQRTGWGLKQAKDYVDSLEGR